MVNKEFLEKHEEDIMLTNETIQDLNLNNLKLKKIFFDECSLINLEWKEIECTNLFWKGGKIEEVNFSKCRFIESFFQDMVLENVDFTKSFFKTEELDYRATFSDSKFDGVELINIGMRYSEFINCSLVGMSSSLGIFESCKFSSSCLENIVLDGTAIWGEIIEECNFNNSILKQASFQDLEIKNSNFCNSSFISYGIYESNLNNVNLNRVKVDLMLAEQSRFIDCDFNGAVIFESDFEECEFKNINVENTSFEQVTFLECDLKDIDFTKAIFRNVKFEQCNVDGALFNDIQKKECSFT